MPIIYCQPENEEEFQSYLQVRFEVLRKPLNMPQGTEKDELDLEAIHIIAKDGRKIVGGGRIHFVDEKTAQVRFMAVLNSFKGQGIGAEILLNLEKFAFNQGRNKIFLNAREPAVGFYEKCGYKVVSGPFDLIGIQHFLMEKIKKI
jgi:predicted GNAT family N-acyltransferase